MASAGIFTVTGVEYHARYAFDGDVRLYQKRGNGWHLLSVHDSISEAKRAAGYEDELARREAVADRHCAACGALCNDPDWRSCHECGEVLP